MADPDGVGLVGYGPRVIDAEEFATLVRLFGEGIRISPDGSVTIQRRSPVVHSDGEKASDRPSGTRDRGT